MKKLSIFFIAAYSGALSKTYNIYTSSVCPNGRLEQRWDFYDDNGTKNLSDDTWLRSNGVGCDGEWWSAAPPKAKKEEKKIEPSFISQVINYNLNLNSF
jgi:hypothetical protein